MADPNQNPRERIAAAEFEQILSKNWFDPSYLRKEIRALREANRLTPRPASVQIDGREVTREAAERDLTQFFNSLPSDASRIQTLDLSNPEHIALLDDLVISVAGLTPTPPPSNIPVNLQELVKIHEAALATQAATAPAGADLAAIFARRRDQANVIAELNQIRNAARERLFWAASNSRYVSDLQAAMGIRRSVVEGILKQRIDQVVDQAITAQAFRQAQLLTQDPQQLATYFTKQLQDILKKEGDVAFTALETNKKDKVAALQKIKEAVAAESANAKHSIEEVGKDIRSHPANRDVAAKSAAAAIEKVAVTKLSVKQQERLAGELAKRVGDESAQLRVVARVMPGATPDQQREVLGKIAPLVEAYAKSASAPSPLEIADQNTILSEVRLHPGRFPAPFVRAVRSGAFSTPESAAGVLTLSRELGISVDAAILHAGGVDATRLALSLSNGRRALGLQTMQALSRTDPFVLRLSALGMDQARISQAIQSETLKLPLLRSFQPASASARRSVNLGEFFRSANPFPAISYNFGRIPPVRSIAAPIRSFFSGLRVQYGFGRIGRGFRAASRLPFAPFRAVGGMVGRGVGAVKSWAGVKIRSGLARAGAWLAKKGVTTAAAKLGGALLSKGTAALLAQAVPIVGQVVGALTALSAIGDIGKFLWDHKEGAAKLGLGLLVAGGLILKGILGAVGSAIWGLLGGGIGAAIGFALGGPVGALIGGGIGTGIGLWVGSGGLASLSSGIGSMIGSAATGIGNFLGALTAPSLTAGLGGTIATVGIGSLAFGAAITTFFIQPAINAALFVPSGIGGISGGNYLPGCPAEMWPVDLLKGQTYYIAQGPGGWATHGPSLPNQEPNCPTDRDPDRRCSYVEAIDIAPPIGVVTPDNVIIASHPGTVIKAAVDGYGSNYVQVQDNCGANFISVYVHMSVVSVLEGQPINTGDPIGIMGSTGRSSGPHLHYEFRNPNGSYKTRQDPPPFMIQPFIPKTVPGGCVQNCNVSLP